MSWFNVDSINNLAHYRPCMSRIVENQPKKREREKICCKLVCFVPKKKKTTQNSQDRKIELILLFIFEVFEMSWMLKNLYLSIFSAFTVLQACFRTTITDIKLLIESNQTNCCCCYCCSFLLLLLFACFLVFYCTSFSLSNDSILFASNYIAVFYRKVCVYALNVERWTCLCVNLSQLMCKRFNLILNSIQKKKQNRFSFHGYKSDKRTTIDDYIRNAK